MNTREELLKYLEDNNAFANKEKTLLTSGIVRFIKNRPEILKELQVFTNIYTDNIPELIFNLVNPNCTKVCEICGKPTKFQKYYNGYVKACSKKCSSLLTKQKGASTKLKVYGDSKYNNISKAKQTCLEKYGVDHFTNPEKRKQTCIKKYNKNWVNNIEKGRKTCLEKYGVDNVMKTKEAQEKQKSTNLLRRGVEYAMQSEETKQHYKDNCKAKTGCEWYTQTVETKRKKEVLRLQRIEAFEKENNCTERVKILKKYGRAWIQLNLPSMRQGKFVFISDEYLPLIQKSFENAKLNASCAESEITEYCKSIMPDLEIRQHCRNLIKSIKGSNLELDIYIPEKKLAIEYNRIYWHAFKDKNYHLHKTEECEKLGIRLLHIWEDLWLSKKEIYKSIIASALGIYEQKLYARKCICKEISSLEYETFLEKNHIQGPVKSSIRLGLFYNNELVQVAGWGKSRFKSGELELHRMCSKLHTQIIGGFSKLIKHSNLHNFISYVDRSLFNGKGYLNSGFTLKGTTPVGYFYHDYSSSSLRVSRFKAQKFKLKNWLPNFDVSLTEEENMMVNGYNKLWDCGNYIVEYLK